MRRVPLLMVLGGIVALVGLVLAIGSRADQVLVAPGSTELPTTEGPHESEDWHDPCLLVEDMGGGVTHTVQVPDCVATTNPPSFPGCDVPRTTLQGDTDLPCTTSASAKPTNSLGMEPEELARYCNAIARTIFAEPGEQYVEEVGNLAQLAPSEHREVWGQMAELAIDFTYPVFNSAADRLDEIGDELDQMCPNPAFVVDDEGLLRYRG